MKEDISSDKRRSFPVDPNLPRWQCQNCRHALCIVSVDFYGNESASRAGMQGSSVHGGAGSIMSPTKMDHSFVVLPKQKNSSQGNVPPRPRAGPGDTRASGKAMEDSFVVLPPAAASIYISESGSDGGAQLPSSGGIPGHHSSITVLKRAFDIATTQTQVEQPLCLECMWVLSDKLDNEVDDVNKDVKAYEACLQRLEGETRNVTSEANFFREKLKIEEEERRLEAAIEETEKQCIVVDAELKDLKVKSNRFKDLEERYSHEFNNFQFRLTRHQEESDSIFAKTEVIQAHIDSLKLINVFNDAFPISHDGEFGTINNFRLGRLPMIPFEWDEINAAWGQACLLLHTMAQYFWPKFPYRTKILPMGSYPRIMDGNNNTYELFGPVNLFWSTRYDKAMTLFLTCLKEFAEFANSKDQENYIAPEKCFKLPYKIENDKVVTHSITLSFNKQENWTKALKYTLINLKWALFWFVSYTNSQPLSSMVSSTSEVPAVGCLYCDIYQV
ncbi:hypothetical protein MKW94_018118 [Papaver nudicaule]|uniref:Beclin-1-like protein n=1 Tax=Papaver nudicaule TaxID=74823 RepID=A0AA41VD49_PAPNU|nr:hypothetical protein [Papaver nudicaule]